MSNYFARSISRIGWQSCSLLVCSVFIVFAALALEVRSVQAQSDTGEVCPIDRYHVWDSMCAVYAAYSPTDNKHERSAALFGKSITPELQLSRQCLSDPISCSPVSNSVTYNTFQHFENGMLIRNADEGTVFALFRDILDIYDTDLYLRNNKAGGALGLPISSEIGGPNNCRAYFEHGMINCSDPAPVIWGNAQSDPEFAERHSNIQLPSLRWPFNSAGNYTGGPHHWVENVGSGLDVNLIQDLATKESWTVLAMASGTVVGVKNHEGCEQGHDTGCWIAIRSDFSGVVLVYGHIPRTTIEHRVGDYVKQGNPIGRIVEGEHVGQCRNANGEYAPCEVHLHVELRDGTQNGDGFTDSSNKTRYYGNSLSWHGVIIDDYLISSYFSQSDGRSSSFVNYQGTAVKGVSLATGHRYSQSELVSSLSSSYTFVKTKSPGNYASSSWVWMTTSTYSTCAAENTDKESPICDILPNTRRSTYDNTVFADTSTRAEVNPTAYAADGDSLDATSADPMRSVLVSSNQEIPYVPRFTIPYPTGPVLSSPGSNSCPTDGSPGVYFYSQSQYGGVCYYATANVATFIGTSLEGRQVTSVSIIGAYQAKLRTQDNRSREINRPGIDDLSKDSTYASPYIAAEVASLLDNFNVTNIRSASGRSYTLKANCSKGTEYYTDRSQTILRFNQNASKLNGLPCIATANDDKQNSNRGLLTFELSKPARIYVLVDSRTTRFPGVFGDSSKYERKSGWEVEVSSTDLGHFEVLTCDSKAGRVVLPGPKYDGGDGSKAMYVVMLDPSISDGSKNCGVSAPSAPALTSPTDGSSFMVDQAVTFSWQGDGDKYELLVTDDTSYNFSSSWISANSYTLSNLPVGHSYRWSVRAKDFVQVGMPSPSRVFTVRPPAQTIRQSLWEGCHPYIEWSPESLVRGYQIYRNNQLLATYLTNYQSRYFGFGDSFLMDMAEKAALFIDMSFETNVRYVYDIRSLVENVESPASNQLTIFVPDLNNDCVTDMDDVDLLVPFIFGEQTVIPPGYDVIPDGVVDLRDVVELLKYVDFGDTNTGAVSAAQAAGALRRSADSALASFQILGAYKTTGPIKDFVVTGSILYLLADAAGGPEVTTSQLYVIDISDPRNPHTLTEYSLAGRGGNIAVEKNLLAVTTAASAVGAKAQYQLHLASIAETGSLALHGSSSVMDGAVNGIALYDGFAYVAAGEAGVHVFDVRNLAAPALITTLPSGVWASDVTVNSHWAYVVDRQAGLLVWDLANPTAPTLVSRTSLLAAPLDVTVNALYAYIALGTAGIQVINVSNPVYPVSISVYDVSSAATSVSAVSNSLVYANGWDGVQALTVGNPLNSFVIGGYNSTASYVTRVQNHGWRAYAADDQGTLYFLEPPAGTGSIYLPLAANNTQLGLNPVQTIVPTATPTATATPLPATTPTPASTPFAEMGPTLTPTPSSTPESEPPSPPEATLLSVNNVGQCGWTATIQLKGFAPSGPVTIASTANELDCTTGAIAPTSWIQTYPDVVDAAGTLIIATGRNGQGSYIYQFSDSSGSTASVAFNNFPEFTFVSAQGGNSEIHSMRLDGSNRRQLTTDPSNDEGPSWSGDGQHLVFHSNATGRSQLYVMAADGTGRVQLVDSSAADEWPYWSPDNTKIVFSRVADHDGDGRVHSEVFLVTADGFNPQRLTVTNVAGLDAAHSCWPSGWSRDSSKILYYCYNGGSNSIWMMNADGSDQHQLLADGIWNAIPSLTPDETKVVYATYAYGNWDIAVMDTSTLVKTRLTASALTDWRPSVSRDGIKVLFESYGSGSNRIYVMNLDGSLLQELGEGAQPVWRPDLQP